MDIPSFLKEIPPPILTLIIIILLWVAKELWDSKKKLIDKHDDLLQQNTIALIELKVELKGLKEAIAPLIHKTEKLERDINSLHDAKRGWLKRDQ